MTGENKVSNDEEGEEVETREEEAFEVDWTSLFHTLAPGHYHESPRSKRLNYTNGLAQPVQICRKGPSFSDEIANVEYDASEKLNTTRPGWTYLIANILSVVQEEPIYKTKGTESGLKPLMRPEQKNTA